jgi:hypothetical protein
MRVGFLLNHYEPHQVPHVVPTAFALSRLRPGWHVEIMCSTAAEAQFAAEIAALYPGERAVISRLHIPFLARALDPIVRQLSFRRKRAVLRANASLFASLDALVIPELTSLALKDDPRLAHLRLIFTGHGMGDPQARGLGFFEPRSDRADLILLPSRRVRDLALGAGRLRGVPHGVTGYVKLEIAKGPRPQLFRNGRPTVLYNPTQIREKTSWHRFGTRVLDHFARSERYNLIFAPHVLLFRRQFSRRGARLPRRFRTTSTMLIDLGSRASVDMTYLRAADIYLGDQSSQVYEFVNWPRPCVFLDAHGADWQSNPAFRSWSFGPVVDDPDRLGAAIERSVADFDRYRPVQEAAREEDQVRGDLAPSDRGATIIAEFLETGRIAECWL